ncbi:hypothetical protein BH10PSE17_BH10PSE17_24250 [soil metagenome]
MSRCSRRNAQHDVVAVLASHDDGKHFGASGICKTGELHECGHSSERPPSQQIDCAYPLP